MAKQKKIKKEEIKKLTNFKSGYKDKIEVRFDGAIIHLKRQDSDWYEMNRKIILDHEDNEKELEKEVTKHFATLIIGWDNLIFEDQKVPFCLENAEMLLSEERFKEKIIPVANNRDSFATVSELKFNFDVKN